jgi:hypothetical protein
VNHPKIAANAPGKTRAMTTSTTRKKNTRTTIYPTPKPFPSWAAPSTILLKNVVIPSDPERRERKSKDLLLFSVVILSRAKDLRLLFARTNSMWVPQSLP